MRPDILLSLAMLCGHVTLTTTLLWVASSRSPVLIHVVSALVTAVGFILTGPLFLGAENHNVWPGLSLMAFGFMSFLFAYSAIYKSISLRLLVEGAIAYPDAVSIERLHDETVLPRFLERIQLLETGGHLQTSDNLIMITHRGRKFCEKLNYWRVLLGFGESGLYYSSNDTEKG